MSILSRPILSQNPPRIPVLGRAYRFYAAKKWWLWTRANKFRLKYGMGIRIGHNTSISPYAGFMDYGMVEIGSNCSISSTTFITHSGGDRIYEIDSNKNRSSHITIGDYCTIGAGSQILPGVTLGHHCIVGAGATVTKSFPPHSIIASPAATRIGSTVEYLRKHGK